jgi:hypothetical protein
LDTLWAAVSIKAGSGPALSSQTISLGDHNNGPISVPNCITPAVWIAGPGVPVKVGITVMNLGHNPDDEKIGDIAEAIVSTGADDVLPGSGEIIDAMYSVLGPIGFADCDGPVVLQVLLYGGKRGRLPGLKRSSKWYFSGTDNGYDSPTGCGSNSVYDYSGSLLHG